MTRGKLVTFSKFEFVLEILIILYFDLLQLLNERLRVKALNTYYLAFRSPQTLLTMVIAMLIIFVHTTPRRVREGKSEVDTMYSSAFLKGFPGLSDGKESAYNAGDPSLVFWVGKIPWRREWQSTRVFLPGKSHGQRSLAGYSPFRILLWKSFRIINSWCWKETSKFESNLPHFTIEKEMFREV